MRGNGESGYSLLEITIAVVLTVGLMGMIFSIANRNQQVFVTETGVVDMNQNIRTALDLLTRDIQSAGVGLPVTGGNFAAIYYSAGASGAPDSIMMINGDPFAPVADLTGRAAGSAEFFLLPPPDVTVTGSGSNQQFTYSYTDVHGTTVQRPIYKSYADDPRMYIVYDETRAMVFTLTMDGMLTGVGGAQRLKLQHNPTGYLNPPGVFGTVIDNGEPDYDNARVAVVDSMTGYRVDTATGELMRTDDLVNWYSLARGIIDFQVQYRILLRSAGNVVEEKITDSPGDGLDATPSGQLTSRRNIRSLIITIEAETPDFRPGDKGYRRVSHRFEVAPRNFNLLNNNSLSTDS